MIERMAARISELEELVGKPRKTSKNSHVPPSKDDFGKGGGKGRKAQVEQCWRNTQGTRAGKYLILLGADLAPKPGVLTTFFL
jgi:hypothetical protein